MLILSRRRSARALSKLHCAVSINFRHLSKGDTTQSERKLRCSVKPNQFPFREWANVRQCRSMISVRDFIVQATIVTP